MISFISWVNNKELYQDFKESVKSFDCEFVEIGQEAKSISEAYNLGTGKAKGEILVYIHQDIRIIDVNFEKKLIEVLKDEKIGFAGVIGNLIINEGSWWTAGWEDLRGRVWQIDPSGKNKPFLLNFGDYTGKARQVDGLMLCTKKRFEFPEELPGIHFFDMWMCLLAEHKGYYNYIFNGLVEHLSWGDVKSESYFKNLKIYQDKFFRNKVNIKLNFNGDLHRY